MVSVQKILVPVDFSECSWAAMRYAAFLAAKLGATLDLAHVWEPPRHVAPEVMIRRPGEPDQRLVDFARSEAGTQMQHFLADLEREGVAGAQGWLESGDVLESILGLVKREGYDLIVMGTHGRRGLAHLVIGSVAENVVRRASCPVITIHGAPGRSRATPPVL
ncbi:MAG: universal stress protein [Deltaproteobacteria bacterium]|nr:universal stress protein [Deltaproteobacteria bacterium]